MAIVEMLQQRATLTNSIRALMNEFRDKEMPGDKESELSKMEGDFDKLNKQITTEQKQLERERVIGEAQDKTDKAAPKDATRAAFANYIKDPTASAMSHYNALQQDNPSQAGYLVAPEQFMSEIIQTKDNLMFMRQISRVLPPLSKAQSLGFPKRTARMSTFAWGTEISAPTADTTLAFGKREFIPKPATGGILISKTLIRNAAIDAEAYLKTEMVYNQATNEEQAFMTGDGAGKPLGVFTASVDGISTARDFSTGNSATEMKFDGLMGAKYALNAAYHAGASWLFNSQGVLQIAKLKNSDGQYIWQPSVVAGTPDMLLGFPVRMSEYAPKTFTTKLYTGILGNFKEGYWICDSLNMEIQALVELYALSNQVYYIGRQEVDGAPVLEEAFVRIQLA